MERQVFREWCRVLPWLERALRALPDPKLKRASLHELVRSIDVLRGDARVLSQPLREDTTGWSYYNLQDVSYSLNVGVIRSEGGRILTHVFGCYITRRMKDHGLSGCDHSEGTIARELGIIGVPSLLYLVRIERDDEKPPLTVRIWDMRGVNLGRFFARQRRKQQAETLRLLKEAAR